MSRLPYYVVEEFASELINLAGTSEHNAYYLEFLSIYLKECGWTEAEFDEETLNQIDASWDNSDNYIKYWH